ncbi:hypothetical protein CcCBS67573_g04088 [Chytriomyces confervae]|uniref:Cytochrome P450 n=1 Tax=Chytriomyces confervae TaxID=246404 RepID=A0A507FEJ4_9FUNG|nr:hypothetical protein HDU80_005345 [Chytriomyces hyalinus]TPX74654.1 hypothetical protein CcCBS67573_g04088 [Chytriomyces confervae]
MLYASLKAIAALSGLAVAVSLGMYLIARQRANALKRTNPRLTVYPVLIAPFSLLNLLDLIPSWIKIKFPKNWSFEGKYDSFKDTYGFTAFLILSTDSRCHQYDRNDGVFAICTVNQTIVQVANPEMAREMMVNRYKEFLKPIHMYALIDIYGKNIVSTEADEWRRHRKIAAPTFSEQNNALVHESSIQIANQMFSAWENNCITSKDGSKNCSVNVTEDMMEFALSVISSAAFGIDIPWHTQPDHSEFRQGHQLSFKQALEIVVNRLQYWMITPKFMFLLPIKYLRDTKLGFDEFGKYLDHIIDDAEDSASADKPKNLLHMLAKATLAEQSPESRLSKSELKGNSFIFLFAGHETTAGVLQFALTLLAINQEKQKKLHNEIQEVLGDSSTPEYKDLAKLKYVMSIMNETMRLFPPVTGIPKFTATETLTLGPYVFPPNTYVDVNTAGLHYNPATWGEDVREFKPERFMASDALSRLGFAPFSEGPRGCVGKKFAQVEFMTLLTLISINYTWKLPDNVDAAHVLDAAEVVTLKPITPVQLIFTRR